MTSMFAGLIGMYAATRANVRTADAARSIGLGQALQVAFNGGAVMGLSVASLACAGFGEAATSVNGNRLVGHLGVRS